jgi:hypothetical protein
MPAKSDLNRTTRIKTYHAVTAPSTAKVVTMKSLSLEFAAIFSASCSKTPVKAARVPVIREFGLETDPTVTASSASYLSSADAGDPVDRAGLDVDVRSLVNCGGSRPPHDIPLL